MLIDINQEVPNFSGPCTAGELFELSNLRGKTVVVYFYPKNNTPGCTTEGENFRDLHPNFKALNCEIVGISRDTLKSHQNFKEKLQLPFELISDTEEQICSIFDVIKLKNMYGKQVRGIERSTFIVNQKGVLAQQWRGVKVPGHAQAVLDFVCTLSD